MARPLKAITLRSAARTVSAAAVAMPRIRAELPLHRVWALGPRDRKGEAHGGPLR